MGGAVEAGEARSCLRGCEGPQLLEVSSVDGSSVARVLVHEEAEADVCPFQTLKQPQTNTFLDSPRAM